MARPAAPLPSDALRLAALGALHERELRYADLAADVRHVTHRIAGPSVDLTNLPLELLIVEELIAPVDGAGMADNARLRLTDDGLDELRRLLTLPVPAPVEGLARLVLALKMRFLHVLPLDARRAEVDALIATVEAELARLAELQSSHGQAPGVFQDWLAQDIAAARERLRWFRQLRDRLDA